jgi:hypothetical protein
MEMIVGERKTGRWGRNKRNWGREELTRWANGKKQTSSAERGANFGITPMEHFTV